MRKVSAAETESEKGKEFDPRPADQKGRPWAGAESS